VLYVESLFSITHPSKLTNIGIAMCGLWIPAVVNLVGVRQMAWFQNITVVLKFVPLALVGIVGWFFVQHANFGPFNASGGSLYSCIGIAAGVALFSSIGVECASIAAGRVRNPRKNVGRASVLGTGLSAILYLLVTAAVMGLVPHHELENNGAHFVNAFQAMFSHVSWAGKFVAGLAVISGLGALNGWTLVTAEMPWAAAKDGLFVPQFAKTFRDGTPWFGILVSTVVASALMAFAYSGKSGLTVFTYLVDLSVVTVAIPYFFSACAQLAYLVSGRRLVNGWMLGRDLLIASLSVLFSLWVAFTASYQSVYQAMLLLLIGIPIYAFLKARRERLGQVAAPTELTEVEREGEITLVSSD
jgi:APA family basic amino acid/polyamine antiporter